MSFFKLFTKILIGKLFFDQHLYDVFLSKYEVQKVGLNHHLELWIPAEDLEAMNSNITSQIELVSTFK